MQWSILKGTLLSEVRSKSSEVHFCGKNRWKNLKASAKKKIQNLIDENNGIFAMTFSAATINNSIQVLLLNDDDVISKCDFVHVVDTKKNVFTVICVKIEHLIKET